jgi:DNA-binding transcriptional ArsR family regulator
MPVTDPTAIRALAHPLRLDLLELLVATSPATAAQCGRILGVSQANCSFHLRQLAKYGFVEEAPPGEDRRERRWQVTDRHLTLSTVEMEPTVAREFGRVFVAREAERVLQYLGGLDTEPAAWRRGGGGTATTLPMTAAESAELKKQWRALLAPFEERAAQNNHRLEEGQRYVRYYLAATPLPTDLDLGEEA